MIQHASTVYMGKSWPTMVHLAQLWPTEALSHSTLVQSCSQGVLHASSLAHLIFGWKLLQKYGFCMISNITRRFHIIPHLYNVYLKPWKPMYTLWFGHGRRRSGSHCEHKHRPNLDCMKHMFSLDASSIPFFKRYYHAKKTGFPSFLIQCNHPAPSWPSFPQLRIIDEHPGPSQFVALTRLLSDLQSCHGWDVAVQNLWPWHVLEIWYY